MNRRGLTLVELLVAITLFSIASTLVYHVFAGGMRLSNRLQATLREDASTDLLFARAEKELRNAILLKDIPFRGDNFRMRYATLDGEIRPVVYENLFSIEYAYKNKAGEVIFQPYWTGSFLPKAVRLSASQRSTLIILPQGRIGELGQ